MAQTSFASINLNPNAEPFVPPKYYLVVQPQLDHGHITPAYYYPLPSSYNFMATQPPQQIVYPNPLQHVQQMTQYQTSSPQYYVPAQQVNQSYSYNQNSNGNFMNGHDRSANESLYRWHNPNERGNSRNHRCDQYEYHHQRYPKIQRNYSNENWNNYNRNGYRNHHHKHQPSYQNYNVQYVDHYNHSYNSFHQVIQSRSQSLAQHFGELDVEEIEASVSD